MSIEKVNSAVEMVLPPGVFMTTIPRCVAASTSTLSTPTPARPTTRSLGAASTTFLVTLVSERTTMAATSPTRGRSSDSDNRCSRTDTLNSDRCCNRAIPLGEIGSQTNTFITQAGHCRGSSGAGQTLKHEGHEGGPKAGDPNPGRIQARGGDLVPASYRCHELHGDEPYE